MDEVKPFDIPKREVWEAFKKGKANQGAAGVDGQSIADFRRPPFSIRGGPGLHYGCRSNMCGSDYTPRDFRRGRIVRIKHSF